MTASRLPTDFVAEAETALAAGDRAHLILQSIEVEGLSWSDAGKALTAQFLAQLNPPKPTDRVVLFSGHRIDTPDRADPRFPANQEPVARTAILEMLRQQEEQGHVTGLSGAANGGDILFLEACRQLGSEFRLLLALPAAQFVEKSVATAKGNWVDRFESLAHESEPVILASSKVMPQWLSTKPNYNFWARNNLWMISSALALGPKHFILAALWDGSKGDGPGGTENMVLQAQRFGAELIHLDTRKLFRIGGVTHSAKP